MAQVDFSNAILEPNGGNKPLSQGSYLRLYWDPQLFNASVNVITTNHQMSKLVTNPNKVTVLYTGTFTANGTEFYIGGGSMIWKVSNISFSSGDTYSFAIDIDIAITT